MGKIVMTDKALEKSPKSLEQPDMEEKTGNKTEKKIVVRSVKI